MGQSIFPTSKKIRFLSMFRLYLLTLKCIAILLLDQKDGGIQLYQLAR